VEGRLSPEPATPAGAAGGRPLLYLRPSVEPFTASNGDLFLMRSGDTDLCVSHADGADRAIVAALAERPTPPAELASRVGLDEARLNEKLEALSSAGVLVELASRAPLDPADAARFSRQLPYLAELGDPKVLQRRLRDSRVVVVGCGGLGTWALAALASTGIGEFALIDDDSVELSNLNRQILYREADLGAAKVDEAARWLAGFDAQIRVTTERRRIRGPENLRDVVADAAVVVLTADWPPYMLARWVNAACIEARVPFVLAGQAPPIVKVGPIYWPGRSACFACHEQALRATSSHYDDYVEHAQGATLRSATLGPASGIVGAMLGMELLHLLTGAEPATLGAAIVVDLRTLQTERTEVPRLPTCVACQHLHR
jgi:bacteriocin biosynthesis cyclodehydratase domain-containing protein